jgi:hypothetical protein
MKLKAAIANAIKNAQATPRRKRPSYKGLYVFVPKNRKTRDTLMLRDPALNPVDQTTTDLAEAKKFPYRQSAASYLARRPALKKKFRYQRRDAK